MGEGEQGVNGKIVKICLFQFVFTPLNIFTGIEENYARGAKSDERGLKQE